MRRGSAKGGGTRDARVKVPPFKLGDLRPRNTATVRPLWWQRFFYRLPLGVANQGKFCAQTLVKKVPCGRLILTHHSHIKSRCIKVFKVHSSQELMPGLHGLRDGSTTAVAKMTQIVALPSRGILKIRSYMQTYRIRATLCLPRPTLTPEMSEL